MKSKIVIFWYRRDLRIEDNIGLEQALSSGCKVLPVFIFDTTILDQLDSSSDRRVDYIHQALTAMNKTLSHYQTGIKIYRGKPPEVFRKIIEQYDIQAVYCNRDYEPYAINRDRCVKELLQAKGIEFHDFKDQVIFEKSEVVKDNGMPYTVFTPYSKKWKINLNEGHYAESVIRFEQFLKESERDICSLESIGFKRTDIIFSSPKIDEELLKKYAVTRDFPALDGTSHLGMALRFGTISIRRCVSVALKHNETWLNELIWREFFMQILYNFPQVVSRSFKRQYDLIDWRNNEDEFELWCTGNTGYPIVDAGMRQLNQTGFMHNRVRMITASFLCKHLLIDWRWGEAYFSKHLNDYDLSANNGNWQWTCGSGCDAAPYFRIFNPTSQTLKFDKEMEYVKRWNPDFELRIEQPVVEHQFARERALKVYGKALKNSK